MAQQIYSNIVKRYVLSALIGIMRASRRDHEGSSHFLHLLRTVTPSALGTSALNLLHSRISMKLTIIQRDQIGTNTQSLP